MSKDKADRLIAMTERLTEALKADIAALERGRPRDMRSIAPDMQQLAATFGRESAAFTIATTKSIPAATRSRLIDATRTFKETLKLQTRMITRVKAVSEGMIHAIADDVARRQNAGKPYARNTAQPRSSGAMVYNGLA